MTEDDLLEIERLVAAAAAVAGQPLPWAPSDQETYDRARTTALVVVPELVAEVRRLRAALDAQEKDPRMQRPSR